MWKDAEDSKKTKWLSKEEINKQLLESIIINEVGESEELNKKAEEIQESEEAAELIKQYEHIIKTKKKGIIRTRIIKERFLKDLKRKKTMLNLLVN